MLNWGMLTLSPPAFRNVNPLATTHHRYLCCSYTLTFLMLLVRRLHVPFALEQELCVQLFMITRNNKPHDLVPMTHTVQMFRSVLNTHYSLQSSQLSDSLPRGQDSLLRGQDSLPRGQDSLLRGQDSLPRGQDSLLTVYSAGCSSQSLTPTVQLCRNAKWCFGI